MYFPQEISDGTVESRTIKRNFTMNVIQFVEMSLLDDEIGKETAEIDRTEKRGTYATTLRLLKTYSVHVTKFYWKLHINIQDPVSYCRIKLTNQLLIPFAARSM